MGKKTRQKLQAELEAEQRIEAALASVKNSGKTYRGVVGAEIMPSRGKQYHKNILRDTASWTYKGKSKNKLKQQLELIRHAFARYRVPRFLEEAFVNEDSNYDRYGEWYLAVAQGRSLYKTCTRDFNMSKKDTHFFLLAPEELNTQEAVWWAKSMAINEDIGLAYRISQSVLARRSYQSEFACDVHRFFVNNPCPIEEIQHLHDYIMAQVEGQPNGWSIKKRSLESLRRQSEVWHRDMAKMRTIGGGSWEGLDIAPWKYKTGKFNHDPAKNQEREWHLFEILTGNELAKEGNAMRHCVAGYKSRCMKGTTGIFALRSNTVLKPNQRHLTIEVVKQHNYLQAVQIRGLANRLGRDHELDIVRRWANDRGIQVRNTRW
jgi:hypothetical protein